MIHAPLNGSTGYQGSCFVLDSDKKGFSQSEKEAIRMLADQVGVAIQNARVYREKEDLLLEILLSLTRAIDAKSKWTGGHSGRVSAYAVELGSRAGLDAATLESLKMSGHLHDIGKLATPEAILDKPGKLTDEEYAIIKKHPEDGARIVGPVDREKRYVPGILHHHERWDGKGYPSGLSGEAIPLQARILCVADVWDAISAERPYRSGMPREKALIFMKENREVIFDPVLLDLFVGIQSGKTK
ncbi:MAG: HD domain-containing protein [Spirochaetia bacterium]|nr:HD domain-containing protein [Spirochaetia bacterium]